MKDKINFILKIVAITIGYLGLILYVIPILKIGDVNVFGYELTLAPTNFSFSTMTFLILLLAPIGATLLLFENKLKNISLISLLLYFLGVIMLVTLPNFASLFANEEITFSLHYLVIIYSVFLGLATLIIFYLLNLNNQYNVYEIVESAMLIALAVGLDFDGLKITLGASGGSISFTTIPLAILALRQGPIKGFLGIGVIYGLITCILDGWGLYTFPFDYLLAYGSIAIFGFFKQLIIKSDAKYNWKSIVFTIVASLFASALRWLFASISGLVLYETPFVESLIYNAVYVLPSGAIMLVLLIALYKPICLIDRLFINKAKNNI